MSRFVDQAALREHLGAGPALVSLESEEALLGAILRSPEACDAAIEVVTVEMFSDGVSGKVWGILALARQNSRVLAPAIIRDSFGTDPAFEAWGGLPRLLDLAENGSAAGVDDHAVALADRATRRALATLLDTATVKVGNTASGDAVGILAEIEHGCARIAETGSTAGRWFDAGSMVAAAIEHARQQTGVINFPIGLREVDGLTGGLTAGEVTVLGAQTGMGKTIAGLQVAKANASAGIGTLYYSLEMSENALGIRLACDVAYDRMRPVFLSRISDPTIDRAAKGDLTPDQWQQLADAEAIIHRWPLKFDTRPGLTMAQMEAGARRVHRAWRRAGIKPGPVIIDHIGKVKPAKDRRGDRTGELTDISSDASEMAKRLGVPVVILTQLNRDVDKRGEDKRPVLSDIKQAAAIAEDARQVIFIYRPEHHHRAPMAHEDAQARMEREEKLNAVRNRMYWLVEKNSGGPRGELLTWCEAACSAVRNWNPHD